MEGGGKTVAGKARLGSWTVSADSRIQVCGLCVTLLLFVFVRHAHAGSVFEGRVVGVSDGDTITVLVGGHEQIKVRLAEIDAPEKAQPFGQRSKQARYYLTQCGVRSLNGDGDGIPCESLCGGVSMRRLPWRISLDQEYRFRYIPTWDGPLKR